MMSPADLLRVSFAILALLSLAVATTHPPPDRINNDDEAPFNSTRAVAGRINDCAPSTYENQGSDASPWANDCLQIAANINKGGTWKLHGLGQRKLAEYGSCHFGADIQGISCLPVEIGNSDIIDSIRKSVEKFKRNDGRVGAKGSFLCECSGGINGKRNKVNWGLY